MAAAQKSLCAAALLFGAASATAVQESSGGNPVSKIVKLIEAMKMQVEKESKEDLKSYDKYNCWCTTNEKEKTDAIGTAEQQISDLTTFIEESKALQGQLKTEIDGLTTDIAEDNDALQTASASRKEEHDSFLAQEADLQETRGLLQEAVKTLSSVQLAQTVENRQRAAEALVQVSKIVRRRHPNFKNVMQQDLFDMLGSLKSHAAFRGGLALDEQEPKGSVQAKSYNSKSGRIFGILDEMASQTTRDLAAAQKADFNAEVNFQKLRAAKLSEISAATEQKDLKETQLSDSMYNADKAQEDLESTEKALAADQKFLGQVRKSCKVEAQEYNSRVKARSEEIKGLGEVLKILTDDAARASFGKTMSFLQVATSGTSSRAATQDRAAEAAMRRIAKTARKHQNWAMLSLAVRMRLDNFAKIKEAMDKMLAELQTQQREEYDKREWCNKEIDATEDKIWTSKNTKEDLGERNTELTNKLNTLNSEIETLKNQVADMEINLKKAGEERHEENALFQTSVMDQRATISILQKALKRLQQMYSFVQTGSSYEPPPPEKPKGYEKSGAAGGVLQMLQKVVTDAEITEQELKRSEQKQQEDYAAYVQVTAESIQANRATIQEKSAQAAETSAALSETKEAQMANNAELFSLTSLLNGHHLDCDWLLKNFDTRQTARAEEMESIKDAKAILSGAK